MIGPLAVSSLAWPPAEMDAVLALLNALGCGGVEIAPFSVFNRWNGIADEARRLRASIEAQNLECVALQGVLFGAEDVSLFGTEAQRERLEAHLDHVAALAGILGARACVFGAPRQRDPGALGADEAWDMALGGLRRIGPAFDAVGSALAFEANARQYGCRFVSTTAEAARLVSEAACPGIALQIDTGTLFLEHEEPGVLDEAVPLAVHAHVSEPGLQTVGAHGLDHEGIASVLHSNGYSGSLSVEMKHEDGADWRAAITGAVRFVQRVYLGADTGG